MTMFNCKNGDQINNAYKNSDATSTWKRTVKVDMLLNCLNDLNKKPIVLLALLTITKTWSSNDKLVEKQI